MEKFNYKNVMLIDDVHLDNFVSETVITSYYFAETVYIQTTGESALKFLKELGKGSTHRFPEVIFIDINMPVMDGFQFLENLKRELKEEITLFRPKLVMLTSSVFSSDQQRARKGFESIMFIVKPLTEETLKLI